MQELKQVAAAMDKVRASVAALRNAATRAARAVCALDPEPSGIRQVLPGERLGVHRVERLVEAGVPKEKAETMNRHDRRDLVADAMRSRTETRPRSFKKRPKKKSR